MDVLIKMKSGEVKEFRRGIRIGSSADQQLKLERAFVIVIDVWENKTIIPAADIAEIKTFA